MNIKNLVIILLLASQTCPLFCMTKIQQKPSAYTSSTIDITPRMLLLGAGIGAVGYFLYKKYQAKRRLMVEDARKNLFFACSQLEGLPLVEDALNVGVDINVRDEDGQTPLIIATIFRRYEIVKALLERDADVTIEDNYGKAAIDYAPRTSYAEDRLDERTILGILQISIWKKEYDNEPDIL